MCVVAVAASTVRNTSSTAAASDTASSVAMRHRAHAPKTELIYSAQYKRISIPELLNHDSSTAAPKKEQVEQRTKKMLGAPVKSEAVPAPNIPTAFASPRSNTPSPSSVARRPQGRPITQKLVGMFTIYDCKEDLILDLVRTECLQLLRGPSAPIVKRPNVSCLQKIIDLKEPTIYDQLKIQFQTDDTLQFIKLIRDHKGKLLRLETVPCNESQINIDFIKRNVCYPRYKSNMKFYLIRSDSLQNKFIYYHNRGTFEREKHLIDLNIEVWVR
ncbi:HDR025Wp [Eremothecium sinecaudum]|uniref:HDR025Wp n=1 Tax=Eremothecium sinecaudum TaxID=45286 RepID=A0A0X8HSU5_9SACH|nr:HDR025Wp [Eremothecium sinecaudum]AMD20768.1 HDR025Wp [Eremothecium sinecaudum]